MRIVKWTEVRQPVSPPPFGGAFSMHMEKIRNPNARTVSVAAWALLYEVLLENGLPVGDVQFGLHGKPYFIEENVHFSISHAGQVAAVSVSDAPTGVDVEDCGRTVSPRMVDRCLSPAEKEVFNGDFIRLWCRKESVVKLTGDGLYGYPANVDAFDPRYVFYEELLRLPAGDFRITAAFSTTSAAGVVCGTSE